VSLQTLLGELNDAGNELNIVVLDACRDNPFGWSRGGSRGLQVVSNQPADSIIVYATREGSTAADGTGRNGLFTTHLLNNMKKPGLSVRDVFDQTGADVRRASGGAQIPAIYLQFFDVAYLGTRPAAVVQPSPAPVQPAAPPEVNPQPSPRPAPANMVRVEGGTFQMGTNDNDQVFEKPVHTVTVKSFYMGRTEVTQKEWREVMGNNPSNSRGDNLPVENISWYEAIEDCNKLSLKEGLTPAYRGSGNNIICDFNAPTYRLPTEAEWEYAAKGGNKDYISYEYSGGDSIDSVAWYSGNSSRKTHPVGTKQPNSLGLYDMSGNVSEYCWDWYGSYGGGNQSNPVGPAGPASWGAYRVLRGGSWFDDAADTRSAARSISTPSGRSYGRGFRVVRP
jgi:formylglycine-generating enzyme required for sulfatase activity